MYNCNKSPTPQIKFFRHNDPPLIYYANSIITSFFSQYFFL